ncbi:hypothetical protein [Spirosoma areae]
MSRSGEFAKKSLMKASKEGVQRFLERRFDWIALVIITLLILFSLILF